MIVRHVRLNDLGEILQLANSIKLKNNSPKEGGFLVYVLDEGGYKERIHLSSYFYVAESKNKIIGFLMCYDNKTLTDLKNKNLLDYEDKTVNLILSQNRPFLFGDQIGVISSHRSQGIGKSMIKQLFEDMKKQNIKRIYVAVLHKPFKNIASLGFCKKLGFNFLQEVENKDNLVWGIYYLNLD